MGWQSGRLSNAIFNIALQKQGADILGLEYKEISPQITIKEYMGNDLPKNISASLNILLMV